MVKKKWIFFCIKIAIAAITLFIVAKTVDFYQIKKALLDPEYPNFIIAAFILLIPNLTIQWYRWHYLLKLIKPEVRIIESIRSLFGGMVIGFLTPGRIGEVSRSLFLRDVDGIQAVGMVFIDKLYVLLTIFIGGIWGIMWLLFSRFDFSTFIVWPLCMVTVLLTLLGLGMMVQPKWIRSMVYHLSLLLPRRERLKRFIDCIDQIEKKHALDYTLLSFFLYIIFIIQFCLLAFAFQRIPWIHTLSATTSTMFAKTLLPISFGDLGIRELASVFFFVQFQVEEVTAINSALVLFAINILLPVAVGLFFLPWMRWNKRRNTEPVMSMKEL